MGTEGGSEAVGGVGSVETLKFRITTATETTAPEIPCLT
jgi:hypothetical protein